MPSAVPYPSSRILHSIQQCGHHSHVPYRSVSTANTSVAALNGGISVIVQHAPLPSITSSMMLWWFQHLTGKGATCQMEVKGVAALQ